LTVTFAILGPGTLGLSFARHAAEQGFQVRIAGRSPKHAEEKLERVRGRWRGPQISSSDENSSEVPSPSWMERIIACRDIEEALEGAGALLEARQIAATTAPPSPLPPR